MGLFNRKKSDQSDVNDYYASERRRRIGMAWVLGVATLLLTLAIALALFYGGRWVYRTVFDDDSSDTTSQEANGPVESGILNGENEEDAPGIFDDEDREAGNSDGSDQSDAQSTDDSDEDETLPNSGPTPENLPSTGPSGPEELR